MSFNLGAVVPLSFTVKDATGALVNAGSVSVTVTLPDLTTVTQGPVTPTSTGVYNYGYPTTQAGHHDVRWVATGVNAGAFTDVFEVLPPAPPQIVSLAEAKDQLNVPQTDTAGDGELLEMIRSATAVVEQYTGVVARRTAVETFHGGKPHVGLSRTPVLAVTQVVDRGTVRTADEWSLNTDTGVLTRTAGGVYALPFLPGWNSVVVTYTAGMPTIPPNVRLAALIIIQHLWETQRPAGRSPFDQNSDEYDPRYTYTVPRRALELLDDPIGKFA